MRKDEINMHYIPTVTETDGRITKSQDIFSRTLQDRIIFLHGEVTDDSAQLIITQLIYLESQSPSEPILLYINSPGGSVTAGLAIKNTMDYIKCPVYTIGMGMCASMGAFLLASGEYGHRYVLPDTTVMIHQVLGGYQGQCTDIQIHAEYTQRLKNILNKYLAEYSHGKKTYEEMVQECERDNFLSAETALDYGLIDSIVKNADDIGLK